MNNPYTTQDTINDFWPNHAGCTERYGPPTPDRDAGILCGCGMVLKKGRPAPDPFAPEEPAQGAYGTWGPRDEPEPPPDGDLQDEGEAGEVGEAAERADVPEPDGTVVAAPGRSVTPLPGSGVPILPPPDTPSDDPIWAHTHPLDPDEPYTPVDVEHQMVDILRRLETGEKFLRQQLARLHAAEHAYTMRHALALATSEQRAADQRAAEAVLACEHESYEMTEAKMLVSALKGTLHTLRAQLSGFQSVAKSISQSLNGPQIGR
jgi:hypothetical protein